MRFTGNRDDALDVLQETFAYLLKKFPGFELSARMTTFLYPAVRHLSATARRRRLRVAADDTADDPVSPAVSQSTDAVRAELAAVMRELSEDHREVVLMRFVDDMTLEEIAAALGIPVGTVKSRLHHALERLRRDARTRAYSGAE